MVPICSQLATVHSLSMCFYEYMWMAASVIPVTFCTNCFNCTWTCMCISDIYVHISKSIGGRAPATESTSLLACLLSCSKSPELLHLCCYAHEVIVIIEEALSLVNPPVEVRSFKPSVK